MSLECQSLDSLMQLIHQHREQLQFLQDMNMLTEMKEKNIMKDIDAIFCII